MSLRTLVFLLLMAIGSAKLFCPPPNLIANANRTGRGLRTAIISEIHGKLWMKTQIYPLHWSEYFDGTMLSRYLYNHIGMLGIDKMYITVFFNETLYPNGPTVEEIYPSNQSCVVDWYNRGYLDWRPRVYAGKNISTWPLDSTGQPTRDRAYFKTKMGYNPTYADIKDQYDWLFVMDTDEQIAVVNFDVKTAPSDWCGPQHPSLISRVFEQMLITATQSRIDSFENMMDTQAKHDVIPKSDQVCPVGMSYCSSCHKCKAISSFQMPIYLWTREKRAKSTDFPTIRSKFPCNYVPNLKSAPRRGHEENWKSVYNTKRNPPLTGKALHCNDIKSDQIFSVLTPRDFHGRLSLELAHLRGGQDRELSKVNSTEKMVNSTQMTALFEAYQLCMSRL